MADKLDLDQILAFAKDTARQAGKLITDGQKRRMQENASQDEKMNSVDLVTEVDKQVEDFITQTIKKKYPDHKFIGEETYDGQKITDDPTWIVDPIDGTTNFIHGFPFVACSIGFAVKGKPVVGVVYNPFLNQMYSAAEGRGAYADDTKLPRTKKGLSDLGEALVAVEYGSSRRDPALKNKLESFKKLTGDKQDGGKMVHSLRSVGSAAINLCMVAAGDIDVYWEIGCWPWDVCAGMCILAEAGGASFGSKASTETDGAPTAKIMEGRKYLFVRYIKPDSDADTVLGCQGHIAKEFYSTVEEWDA